VPSVNEAKMKLKDWVEYNGVSRNKISANTASPIAIIAHYINMAIPTKTQIAIFTTTVKAE